MIGASILIAGALVLPVESDVQRFCDEIVSTDRAVRDRAVRELSAWLADPVRLTALLADVAALPAEVKLQLRDAVTRTPWAAPSLSCVAAGEPGPVASGATALLESLLLHEVARRVAREDLRDGNSDPSPFSASVVTGLAWPVGDDVPLLHVIEWLSRVAEPVKPIVASPDLDLDAIAAVEPAELVPGTAAGILVRVLAARRLETLDVGPVRLVVTADFAEAHRKGTHAVEDPPTDPAEHEDAAATVPEDVAAARLLTRLLVESDAVERSRLFAGLRLPGATDAALPLERAGYAVIGLLARDADDDAYWERLAAGAPAEIRFRTLLELADRGDVARRLTPRLLASDELARMRSGCFLAARCRLVEMTDRLAAAVLGPAPLDASLALAELHPGSSVYAARIVEAVARGLDGGSLRTAIEVLVDLDRAVGLPLAPLLDSADAGARAIGLALLRLRDGDPAAMVGPRPATTLEWATSALAAAARPERDAIDLAHVIGQLAGTRAEGALALVLARHGARGWTGGVFDDFVGWSARDPSGLGLGVIRCIVATDLAADEDYRAGRLRTLLRAHQNGHPLVDIELRELWRSLTEDERGAEVRWLSSAVIPIRP